MFETCLLISICLFIIFEQGLVLGGRIPPLPYPAGRDGQDQEAVPGHDVQQFEIRDAYGGREREAAAARPLGGADAPEQRPARQQGHATSSPEV